jgi:hypothetical protein
LVLEAPFRTWWGQTAFDTASECEAFKQYHVQRAKKGAKETEKNTLSLDFIIRGWEESICIASDDPRLAK